MYCVRLFSLYIVLYSAYLHMLRYWEEADHYTVVLGTCCMHTFFRNRPLSGKVTWSI